MSEITFQVSDEVAETFEAADETSKANMVSAFEAQAKKVADLKRLKAAMDDIGRAVREAGASEKDIQDFIDSLS